MDTFSIEDDELLEKYHTVWDKVTTDIKNLCAIKMLEYLNKILQW